MGQVTKVANGVIYFSGIQQVPDPAGANVTTAQTLQSQFSNKAIANSQGQLLLVNPAPGTLGSMGLKWITGPRAVNPRTASCDHLVRVLNSDPDQPI